MLTMCCFGCTAEKKDLTPSPSAEQSVVPSPGLSNDNDENDENIPSGNPASSTIDKSKEVYVLVQDYNSWVNEHKLVFESVKIVNADGKSLVSVEFSSKNEKLRSEIKDYLANNNILSVDSDSSAIESKDWLIYAYFSDAERMDFEAYFKNKYPNGYGNRLNDNFFMVEYKENCFSAEYHYLSEENSSYSVSTGYDRYYLDSYLYHFVERANRNAEVNENVHLDEYGRVIKRENILTGVITQYTYDDAGNLWYSEDSNGHVWYYDKTEQVENGTIERVRDAEGNILFQKVSLDDDKPRYFDKNGKSMFMTDDMYIYYVSSIKYDRFELSDNKIIYYVSENKQTKERVREEYEISLEGYGALYLSKVTYLDSGVVETYTYADNGELLLKKVMDPSIDFVS